MSRVVSIDGKPIKFRVTPGGVKVISPPDPTGEIAAVVLKLFDH